MKIITLTFIFGLLLSYAFAQTVTGDWYGELNIQGTKLPLVFHITKTGDIYTSTMDSPKQNAKGMATDNTTVNGNLLVISAAKFGITYTGTFMPDSNKINGTFKQGANVFPLNLSANKTLAVMAKPPRPQDPKDFPYKQEDVVFTNPKAGDQLAGTLTMPADGKATKIVILVTGSGPQNRNEEITQFNHRPFLVWSDWLTRQGIAVLRYDDRGIGKSTGNYSTATSADFADDAEAAVNYIRSRDDLKYLAIGIMGHSEGGIIAPMVAARNKEVKFLVLLAGPGVPIVDLMVKQAEDQMRVSGAGEDAIQRSAATDKKLYMLVAQNPELPTVQLRQKVDTLLYAELNTYPKGSLGGRSVEDIVHESDTQLLSPWYRYFIAVHPADYLTKVKCPVLALDGTKDLQVNAEANLAGIKQDLLKGGNKNVETVLMPDLNHLFQKAKTGSVDEYGQIEETVDPAVLQKVSGWINGLK